MVEAGSALSLPSTSLDFGRGQVEGGQVEGGQVEYLEGHHNHPTRLPRMLEPPKKAVRPVKTINAP